MNNKLILGVLIFLLVLGFTAFTRMNQDSSQNIPLENNTNILSSNTNTSVIDLTSNTKKGVSVGELAKHNTQTDCWVAYDGKVYDITTWLPVHPGSAAAIAPYCGTSEEFTKAFENKHGTSKVGKLMKVGVLIGDFDVVGNLK